MRWETMVLAALWLSHSTIRPNCAGMPDWRRCHCWCCSANPPNCADTQSMADHRHSDYSCIDGLWPLTVSYFLFVFDYLDRHLRQRERRKKAALMRLFIRNNNWKWMRSEWMSERACEVDTRIEFREAEIYCHPLMTHHVYFTSPIRSIR